MFVLMDRIPIGCIAIKLTSFIFSGCKVFLLYECFPKFRAYYILQYYLAPSLQNSSLSSSYNCCLGSTCDQSDSRHVSLCTPSAGSSPLIRLYRRAFQTYLILNVNGLSLIINIIHCREEHHCTKP